MEKFSLERIKQYKLDEKEEIIKKISLSGERNRKIYSPDLSDKINIIAEIKQASPTKGTIKSLPSIKDQALLYEKSGAKAISVLTEKNYFQGRWENIKIVSSEVKLPVLCKEFIHYKEQIDLAYLYGADMVLLIAKALSDKELQSFYDYILNKGLKPLVEINDISEIEKVLKLDPEILMVNMRNLSTLEININNGIKTLNAIPGNIKKVSASGITGSTILKRIFDETAANNFLIGTSIMESNSPSKYIEELKNVC